MRSHSSVILFLYFVLTFNIPQLQAEILDQLKNSVISPEKDQCTLSESSCSKKEPNMPGKTAEVNPILASIDDVVIDDNGRFKYILCKVYQDGNKDDSKMIVRGTRQAEFHADIYDHLDAFLEEIGVTCECVGGGKIEHDSIAKTVRVFGQSQGYGKADHSITVRILKEKYPDYNSITWSDD